MMQKFVLAGALVAVAAEGGSLDGSIYIIRHGEKNSEGDLSSTGKKRAKFIATIFPGSEYNKPSALFAGHYSGGTPQRTLHTVQPTADKLGLKVDNSMKNSDHSGAAKAFLAEVGKGNTVLAAWEHCNIRKTCYALASQSMCDKAFTQGAKSDCDWWEVCSGCSDHYDGVVSFTVKNGKVTAVEHHHEHFKSSFNATMVQDTCSLYAINGETCGQSDLDCKYTKYAKAAEKSLQDGTCSSQGYTVKGEVTTKSYPVIGDITITQYTKPALRVQDTCSLYSIQGDTCGQSDLDCKYTKYAKAAEKSLQDGTCSSQGYTVKGAVTTKSYPVIGDITITDYTKPAGIVV